MRLSQRKSSDGVLNVAVSEVILNEPCISALVCGGRSRKRGAACKDER
jgi:hypothetical protein